MGENTWWEYVQETLGTDSNIAAGRRVGIDASAFSRWKNGERPGVDFATKFARGYNRNVLEALAAAGMITPEEANLHTVRVGISDLSTTELAQELLERVRS